MTEFEKMMKDIEKKLGLTLAEIRAMSPEAMIKHIEKISGKPVTIGPAGLHGVIDSEQINADIDKILKKGLFTRIFDYFKRKTD